MARRKTKRRSPTLLTRWWTSASPDQRRRWAKITAGAIGAAAVVIAAVTLYDRLDRHVRTSVRDAFPDATIAFIDLPESMHTLAEGDLRAGVDDLLRRPWTDDALCEDIARRVADVGWVRRVGSVHRLANGRFDISAEYRRPVALVQKESQFVLVDGHGVRLPGRYAYDPRWPLIQGVAAPVPSPGATWPGDDLRAGLAVLERIEPEPFRDQITAILVDNFGGRIHPRSSHIELATDQAGGRIGWGSAPGAEVEENDVEQKLALLRATYRETGRVDGHHAVIDVSTYADRYTIPG